MEVSPMLKHVFYVTVFVSDQDRALDFYTRVLGFQKRFDVPTPAGPRFAAVGVEGQELMLLLWPGTPSGEATIEVEDCREAVEVLTSRGVTFDAPGVLELPFGWVARFQDPDGNKLQLRQGRQAA
jgi:catechol 2,3-dioxygenase-like lactoylglutathione lyase family enzyme